ncbi:U2 snRNP-associated protein Uap2 [Ophiobolus disseminans]|uniref:U2 snRNP-associated protein Uap2 n=1 Tax=Ophiobolus disseminans TaxID=1469910 RepID=A0A6A7AJM1_9PLEO|nr:U2 snRNP-associated protein Uap2 [Ophiobolus disseminans]
MDKDHAAALEQEFEDFLAETGVRVGDSASPIDPVSEPQTSKKRKNAQDTEVVKKPKVQENRAIFVTNLPHDTNEDELEDVFSKYGIIDQGADGNKRIKMYTDDSGEFNGQALIVYFKAASIDLATQMLDDYWFRIEEQNNGTIRVKPADMSYKRNKDADEIVSKLTRKDKKASERNRADLNRKLAEWSDNEEEVKEAFAPKKNKWAKVCIVKHAFTLEELDEDVEAYLEIKEDMRDEAEKFGDVTNVTLFDREKDGICTIRFREFESAEQFAKANNGRSFAKRKLEVTIAEDRQKFKKAPRAEEPTSSDEERAERERAEKELVEKV